METFRKIVLGFLSSLLLFVILVGIPLAAVSKTFTDKNTFVETLQSKALYDQLRNALSDLPLEQAGDPDDQSSNTPSKQAFLSGTDFSPLIDKYFPYDFYQRAVSTIGDSTFNWLAGDTSKLAFEVQITDEPKQFRKDFIDILVTRYKSFPVCKTVVTPDLEQLFAKKCRLPAISPQQIRPVLEQELMNTDLDRFFKKATISSEEFTDKMNAQDIARAQDAYQRAHNLPVIVGFLILILSVLIALLVFNKQKSLRTIGRRLIIPSLLLVVAGLLFKFVAGPTVDRLIADAEPGEAGSYSVVVESIIREFISAISNHWLLYSVGLAIIGGLLIIAQKLINKEAFTLIPTRNRT